ncbi:Hypothetical_protein [Hexamita inflata]|uniref:Hypothetical_protein n=1 Tax=Hexamita inflata TaxID=28002 RepID=A0AA86Q0M2_9EUKA|nr:Hypothetical protein HINF_LOCUS32015 [Hexamita inflata]CAI9944371.1 Hypothetical protein HINF_LOCUS32016 [Hexamita inflata]CAI9944372.1 Hypothetical protein HINF_LOCUS32017 [Hexamita inflata]CAI9964415.1 Hypothetical protein HINF_LOCUS52060 [Hexamita inflata]CAI9964417.1 Hypothetical protein HINF_LOCUS52062 [Hexamita inflata]
MLIIHQKYGNWLSSAAGLMITEPKKASWLWTGLKRLGHAVFFTLFHWSCLPVEFARGEAITCWRVGQATQVIDIMEWVLVSHIYYTAIPVAISQHCLNIQQNC